MSKSIYVVTMENDEMDPVDIGFASTSSIADKMIEKAQSTDGFEYNTYNSYKAPVDYLEINEESIYFGENETYTKDNNDLIVQFAILWGQSIAPPTAVSELELVNEMKQWDSVEIYNLFTEWKNEYLNQTEIDDSVDFFNKKKKELLQKQDIRKSETTVNSFFVCEEPSCKGRYYIGVVIVIYREMLGCYPDFLSQYETDNHNGYSTKFAYLVEEMLTENVAKFRCNELEQKFAAKLRQCENAGDWTDSPIDFHKAELLWSK